MIQEEIPEGERAIEQAIDNLETINTSDVLAERSRKKISQIELADRLGIQKTTLADLERNMIPTMESILAVIQSMPTGVERRGSGRRKRLIQQAQQEQAA